MRHSRFSHVLEAKLPAAPKWRKTEFVRKESQTTQKLQGRQLYQGCPRIVRVDCRRAAALP